MSSSYDSRPDTRRHINRVRSLIDDAIDSLVRRAEIHDESKLVDPELSTFNEYTPKLKDSTYGSDEYKRFLEGMGVGLRHHYEANSHHPEHYPNGIRGMSLLDVVEMLCDWKAATERHADGDLARSIEVNQGRFDYSDDVKAILANTVAELWPAPRSTGGES